MPDERQIDTKAKEIMGLLGDADDAAEDAQQEQSAAPYEGDETESPEAQADGGDTETEDEPGKKAAEHRKAVDAERSARLQDRQAHAQQLGTVITMNVMSNPAVKEVLALSGQGQNAVNALVAAVQGGNIDNLLVGPGWNKLLSENRDGYLAAQASARSILRGLQEAAAEINHAQAIADSGRHAAVRHRQKAARDEIGKSLKIEDPKKLDAALGEINDYLLNQGVPLAMLRAVDSHVPVLFARKAMLYDKLMAEQARLAAAKRNGQTRRNSGATRVLRPESTPDRGQMTADRQRHMARAIKGAGNRMEDLASVIAGGL